ncbi:MAG TPA: tRNA (adenosine(37)-N6)-threonylcarbamoyltransferase complex transferase subunit TsaD [Candidatus Hydrothermia bacterium]|nr:tRNA (adenosine(37)-N6)-threonylcarbamoyltransferase complex transferase subunit TsaD [Candidatus Hydrothermia bacterium]
MKVLGIETSCDETAIGIVDGKFRVVANLSITHLEHSVFGGVVPEIASRMHIKLILPITEEALKRSGLKLEDVDGIAVTYGPGLVGSLLVGLAFGKSLAYFFEKPFVGVNHLEAHMFSIFLNRQVPKEPYLFLIVSGGHTELIVMHKPGEYEILGGTVDDAAGEALDKFAKMLGLPYPGGPMIDQMASSGDPSFYRFPRAKVEGLNFSFSGLKTSALYYIREKGREYILQNINNICASYQEAVVDMLLSKVKKAISSTHIRKLGVVGGVSMNSRIRQKFNEELRDVDLHFPDPEYTVDNGAMIAATGIYYLQRGIQYGFDLPAKPDLIFEK